MLKFRIYENYSSAFNCLKDYFTDGYKLSEEDTVRTKW